LRDAENPNKPIDFRHPCLSFVGAARKRQRPSDGITMLVKAHLRIPDSN
jgi:hypothetical protein